MTPTPAPGGAAPVPAPTGAAAEPTPARPPLAVAWQLGAGELGLGAVGLLGLLLASVGAPTGVLLALGVVLAVVVVLAVRSGVARPPAGTGTGGRLLLLAALPVAIDADDPAHWAPPLLLAVAVLGEAALARLLPLLVPIAAHLPGLAAPRRPRVPARTAGLVDLAALVLVLLLAVLPVPPLLGTLVAVVALLVVLAAALDTAGLVLARRRAERAVPRALRAYAPRFALHWDAAPGTGYQIGRWIPYLDRLGMPYVVFVRNAQSYPEAVRLTDHPVLLRRGARDMDPVMVASIGCVFYVNNALRNVHVVRYPGVRHVQLNHGDSDKATSYNPVFRMFDRNFVAGQAAVDRFAAHGVSTSPDFFAIVGRPQVEDVEPAVPGRPVRRVLYAPTWAGMHSDSAYSSLPLGPAIVTALLARGCEVVYRPHPYTDRSPRLREASARVAAILAQDRDRHGRAHVLGPQAESAWSLIDCFNAVDALVSDVSSVVPDFLFSEKPFAIAAMSGTVEEFYDEMPVARGGYVVAGDGSNLDAVLDDLLGDDPQAGLRHTLKTYYLGDLPAQGYVDVFLDAARAEIGPPR